MTTPTANWNVTTIDGVEYLVINTAQFRIPLDWDPSSNMMIAVAAPNAAVPIGVGGFPALVTGAPGPAPVLSDIINFTGLAATDTTPDSASFSLIGTNLYQLNLTLHDGVAGPPGGTAVLGGSDVAGTPVPGQIMVVNPAGNGLTFVPQRVGDRFVPASIASCPSGNAAFTLCSVPVPAQLFDWRPVVSGQCVVTATGLDLTVDLIARLSNTNTDGGETTGNEVGLAIGLPAGSWLTGPTPTNQVLEAGPPPGSGDSWDRVPAGQIATVFFRIERQTGSDTFTTSAATTRFGVRVAPCPTDLGAVFANPTSGTLPAPQLVTITAAGAFSETAGAGNWPSWATIVDVIELGGGGGGGGALGAGSAGSTTSTTVGAATETAVGGPGGAIGTTTLANSNGASPGSHPYGTNTYTGGVVAPYQHVGYGPGGGGGGSFGSGLYGYGGAAGQWTAQTFSLSGITTITGTVGAGGAAGAAGSAGAGAAGAVWLNFRAY
jgi:hypothetical protein